MFPQLSWRGERLSFRSSGRLARAFGRYEAIVLGQKTLWTHAAAPAHTLPLTTLEVVVPSAVDLEAPPRLGDDESFSLSVRHCLSWTFHCLCRSSTSTSTRSHYSSHSRPSRSASTTPRLGSQQSSRSRTRSPCGERAAHQSSLPFLVLSLPFSAHNCAPLSTGRSRSSSARRPPALSGRLSRSPAAWPSSARASRCCWSTTPSSPGSRCSGQVEETLMPLPQVHCRYSRCHLLKAACVF